MNKNKAYIIAAIITGVAAIVVAIINLYGKNPGVPNIVIQQPAPPSKESSKPRMPQKLEGPESSNGNSSTPPAKPEHTIPPLSKRSNENGDLLQLYCTCKANQTLCFKTESECQEASQGRACVPKFRSAFSFNVFDRQKWHKYQDGWAYNKKCIIDEGRTP
jgi:hypothetical protein